MSEASTEQSTEAEREVMIQEHLALARSYLSGLNYKRDVRYDPDGLQTKTIEELRWYLASKNRFQDDATQIRRAEATLGHRVEEQELRISARREKRSYRVKLAGFVAGTVASFAAIAQALAHLL